MRLRVASLREVQRRLAVPHRNANEAWSARRVVVVTLADERGHVGRGEASPLPGYSPETIDDARAVIEAFAGTEIAPFEVDASIAAWLDAIVARVDARAPSARFAVESAAIDVLGQALDAPAHILWRRITREMRLAESTAAAEVRPVPLCALVDGETPREVDGAVRALAARGIGCVKLKIGRPDRFERELELAAAAREALGPRAGLRLDANRSLPSREGHALLARLARFAPEHVEEPFDADALRAMPAPLPVRIALDESLQGPGGETLLRRAIESHRCEVAVLKPAALGGALACMRLASVARGSGADVVVSHLLDGPIAFAAAAELALALGGARAAGLAPHAGVAAWHGAHVAALGAIELVPHDRPGLGVELLREGT